ncbi:MAG: hypothetical protein FJ388_24850, partial [Verrucomicrobia bacterium]|nr:hypothetical protein [Verrucomicrobiota bacterium]
MQRVHYVVLGLTLALAPGANAAGLNFAPDVTVILLPAKPDDKEAKGAKLLQQWLLKVYRSKTGFAVLTENNAAQIEAKNVIAVGRTQRATDAGPARLSRDGFVIKSRGNTILIRGGSPAGTFYGVCRFLDEFCGVRFYMPGE